MSSMAQARRAALVPTAFLSLVYCQRSRPSVIVRTPAYMSVLGIYILFCLVFIRSDVVARQQVIGGGATAHF